MLRTLISCSLILLTWSTHASHAQYGPVDTTEASERILHNALNDPSIGMVMIRSLDDWNFASWNQASEKLMLHPDSSMRMSGALTIAKSNPANLSDALNRLDSASQRSIILTEVVASELLPPTYARSIVQSVELEPVTQVMLIALNREEPTPEENAQLTAFTQDSSIPVFARGLAAAERAERGNEAALNSWLSEVKTLTTAEQAMLYYELAEISNTLSQKITIKALVNATKNFDNDDLTRATVLLAALTHIPEIGIPTLEKMLKETKDQNIRIALAGLAIETGSTLSAQSLAAFKDGVPLHEKIYAFLITPESKRLQAARPLVEHGHLQTIAWVVTNARTDQSAAATDSMSMIIEHSSGSSADHLELLIEASEILAKRTPEVLTDVIMDSDSKMLKEIHLTSLAKAGTKEAAQAAAPLTSGQPRAIRSMATLAIARGTDLDDSDLKKLGKIAAGAGALPSTLRAPAAWIFLEESDAISSSLPAIITP